MVDEGPVAFSVAGIPYHGITAAMEAAGYAPTCPHCDEKMFPIDDHGRFGCLCKGISYADGVTGLPLPTRPIPQMDTSGMSDEEKARIPAINRLDEPPTADEAMILFGDPDSPEYQAAMQRIAETQER